ncbi:glycoside hydrolase family 73 protein [Peptococcus simiae]|uniref:Glycoside hydrolase family 73 protein n=1 Tax=Peptococcus simiae TaxID=1643805 RepID=A0ABW9GZE5_9FIRM
MAKPRKRPARQRPRQKSKGRKRATQRRSQKSKSRLAIIVVFFVLLALAIMLNNPSSPEAVTVEYTGNHEFYFEQMAPIAQKYGKRQHIHPSLILAQSALESGFGQSDLARIHNNYFGIKRTDKENAATYDTEEVLGGESITVSAEFRAYDSVEASVKDYTKLVGTLPRYRGVVEAETPEAAVKALVKGGYATDPAYAQKLIQIIHTYELDKYDQ